jgi:hypothetical protein
MRQQFQDHYPQIIFRPYSGMFIAISTPTTAARLIAPKQQVLCDGQSNAPLPHGLSLTTASAGREGPARWGSPDEPVAGIASPTIGELRGCTRKQV